MSELVLTSEAELDALQTRIRAVVDGAQQTLEAASKNGVPFRATTYRPEDGLNYSQGAVSVINGNSSAADFLKTVQDQSQSK